LPTPDNEGDVQALFSTYLGGSAGDAATGITVDRDWEIYICGRTGSSDFPTEGPYQAAKSGIAAEASDTFAMKLDSSGAGLLWSTYLGGSAGSSYPSSIRADATRCVYISGTTSASDFPTIDPFQASYGGGPTDGFAAKLASSGSGLLYSTFIGGSGRDRVHGSTLDQRGRFFAAGSTASGDFPTSEDGRGPEGAAAEAFVTKIASGGSSLLFSTALAPGRAADAEISGGSVLVIGESRSGEFTVRDRRPLEKAGEAEPFLAELNGSTGESTFSSGLGAAGPTSGLSLDIDAEGGVYALGSCLPTAFPTRGGIWREAGSGDLWVGKFSSASSSLVFSAFLGGAGKEGGGRIACDWRKDIYVAGTTASDDFPTLASAQSSRAGEGDAFLARISSSGQSLLFSTYWGGSGEDECAGVWADQDACAYICGRTASKDFPTLNAGQAASAGGGDGFAAKFRPPAPPGETFIDRQYHRLSQMVSSTVYRFDSFFGEQIVEEEIDTPWIRVRGSVEIKEKLKLDFAQNFAANVPLPILERRLHTYFGSEADDDLGTDGEFSDTEEDNHFNAGLRYYLKEVANLKPALSGGVQMSGTPVVYVKPRLEWDYTDDPWYLQAIQYVYWYSDDGLGETTRFIANRLLGRRWLARGETDATYSNTSEGVDLSQEFDLRYLDFSLGGVAHFAGSLEWVSKAHTWRCLRADKHTLTLRLRHTVWREWLRLEVAPRLTWERVDPDEGESYWRNASPSIFLIVEVLFEEQK